MHEVVSVTLKTLLMTKNALIVGIIIRFRQDYQYGNVPQFVIFGFKSSTLKITQSHAMQQTCILSLGLTSFPLSRIDLMVGNFSRNNKPLYFLT